MKNIFFLQDLTNRIRPSVLEILEKFIAVLPRQEHFSELLAIALAAHVFLAFPSHIPLLRKGR